MSRSKLGLRLYAFTAIIAIATMAALLVLPRFVGSPRYMSPQAALVQNMVDHLSKRDQPKLTEVVHTRIAERIKGRLSLYAPDGRLLESTVQPPLSPPTADEKAVLATEAKWAVDWGRIVTRSDDGTMLGVYSPDRPGFPWGFVLPLGAGVLVVVGAATLWFSRKLVRPLDQLAAAARTFGTGDTSARANLRRDDEVGDVGQAFDDMADRTAAMIAAQRQLMADVSHELRTPLARIRVALELAAEDPVAATDVLADVGTDLDEIDQLIEDILVTARLETQERQLARREVKVGEVADRAAERFVARHPGRTLERSIRDADRALACDPALLRRALDNLLDNAAKYSDDTVKLDVQPDGGAVAFEVIDRGIGMTPDELERAGTPFWRADGSRARRTGGVGLGLALARRIARAHGGDVSLVSAPGRGTTARLEIPLEGAS